jgi:hypothetical protein
MKQKKAYSSKFTTKANLSNKCNIIWDGKLQETEDKKKRGFLKMDSGKDKLKQVSHLLLCRKRMRKPLLCIGKNSKNKALKLLPAAN